MKPTMPVSVPASNTFESVLRNQRKGVMAADLSDKLAELTRAVCAYGKPGKLVLTLKLNPASGDGTALSIADEVEIKPPAAPKPNSIFFTTEDGQLLREDPAQKELELKVVAPAPLEAPRQIPAAS